MPTVGPQPGITTLADLLRRLGDISPERIRIRPPPGTATELDVVEIERRESRLCELVDGVLVEKIMGYRESLLAMMLGRLLGNFVAEHNLGLVTGPDGVIRLFEGLVRIPDVAFVSWSRIPGGAVPRNPVPNLVPDLAVEVLSQGNTAAEMERKRADYFVAGVRLLWMVDPDARTVQVWEGVDTSRTLSDADVLDGGTVLAGFKLPLRDLFAELDRKAP